MSRFGGPKTPPQNGSKIGKMRKMGWGCPLLFSQENPFGVVSLLGLKKTGFGFPGPAGPGGFPGVFSPPPKRAGVFGKLNFSPKKLFGGFQNIS